MPEITVFEFIQFVQVPGRTDLWNCRNRRGRELLGVVKWYWPWRQYCYFPTAGSVYSDGCLLNIQEFIRELMDERRRR